MQLLSFRIFVNIGGGLNIFPFKNITNENNFCCKDWRPLLLPLWLFIISKGKIGQRTNFFFVLLWGGGGENCFYMKDFNPWSFVENIFCILSPLYLQLSLNSPNCFTSLPQSKLVYLFCGFFFSRLAPGITSGNIYKIPSLTLCNIFRKGVCRADISVVEGHRTVFKWNLCGEEMSLNFILVLELKG